MIPAAPTLGLAPARPTLRPAPAQALASRSPSLTVLGRSLALSVSSPNSLRQMFILCDIDRSVVTDTVALDSGLVIKKQSIGVASTATGFSGVDGILGYANPQIF